ncbi:DUF3348 domain-containing protein [Burkholderia gladioli]|uniref:DUF3348 domain-containing protein n=1 Tax=Burkholderia gladioli TaxID=28095 RepID=UPI0022D1BC49|nr:DUF3348 domain-containing protein [Burkholderia gladioli]MDA0576155.1 DUF3348 domain-containing protein [Burkholderia gladioli]MDA0604302.1 DUF3348 domain-containing protein [Burkholderia gladioli]
MSSLPQRSSLHAPALVRILTRLGGTDVQRTAQPLADRLSQWVAWTDAIALSSVLAAPAPVVAGLRGNGEDEAARGLSLRSSLSKAIANDALLAPARQLRRGGAFAPAQLARPPEPAETDADFALYRQCCLSLQQKMESEIGDLRARLRPRLAAQSPALAKLAALDATMERALAARERSLFGAVPGLLGAYFERLRADAKAARAEAEGEATDGNGNGEAAQAGSGVNDSDNDGGSGPVNGPAAAPAAAPLPQAADVAPPLRARLAQASAPDSWLDTFRKDMQSVLLAELDLRFQPVGGLLAALRAR